MGIKCKLCNVWAMKNSEFCLHHNPDRKLLEHNLPSLKNLNTIEDIKNAYKGLIRGLFRGLINENRAVKTGYLLNSYIKGMKDIFEMKDYLTKQGEETIKIDYGAIEKLEKVVKEMKELQYQFNTSTDTEQSGEIIQPITIKEDSNSIT